MVFILDAIVAERFNRSGDMIFPLFRSPGRDLVQRAGYLRKYLKINANFVH